MLSATPSFDLVVITLVAVLLYAIRSAVSDLRWRLRALLAQRLCSQDRLAKGGFPGNQETPLATRLSRGCAEDVCAAVSHPLGDLATEDVQLYYLYHKLTSIRSKLRDKSRECLAVLQVHPSCNEERTQAILAECDSARHEPIDIENEGRFPRTIDFLKELVIWHDSVMTKHEELKILIHSFDFETRQASIGVEKARQSNGVAASVWASLAVAGGAMAFLGRGYGGLLLPLVGDLSDTYYYEQKRGGHKVKSKIEKLNQDAHQLGYMTKCVDTKRQEMEVTQKRTDTVCHPPLSTLKEHFETLFSFLEGNEKISSK